MGEATTIHICVTCKSADDAPDERAGARLLRAVRELAAERGSDVTIVPVECLSVCKRPVTFGYAAPGKWTYVYADAAPDASAPVILDGAALYAEAPDGLIPWRQRPEHLKRNVIARTPPLAPASPDPSLPEAAE